MKYELQVSIQRDIKVPAGVEPEEARTDDSEMIRRHLATVINRADFTTLAVICE